MHRLLRQRIARLRCLQDRAAVGHPGEHGTTEMRYWLKPAMPVAFLLLTALQAPAQEFSGTDLRDIRIGGEVANLPSTGYADFSCAVDASARPAGWSSWRDC